MIEYGEEFSSIEKVLNEAVLPRLQVIGKRVGEDARNQAWEYCMVYKHFTEGAVKLPISSQTRESFMEASATDLFDEDGNINPTIRIGADSKWDSLQMNMPLFYIADEKVEKVDLTGFKETFKDRIEREISR